MTDDPIDPQGAQPATETAADPAGEQPQDSAALQAELESLDATGLAQALGFDVDDSPPPAQDDEPSDEPADKPAEEDPSDKPGEQPDPSEGDPKPDPKPLNRRRLSVTGIPDEDREMNAAAIDMVRQGKAPNLFEAMKSLVGEPDADPDADPDAGPDDPAPQPETPPTLYQLEERFETASEELAAAIRDFDQDAQIALNKEIALLNRQILRAEQAEEKAKVEVGNYQDQYAQAVAEMEGKYADLLDDEDSPFAELLDEKVEAAKARRDPRLADPRHIVEFADYIAQRVLRVGDAPQPAPHRTPVSAPPRKGPVGSAVAPGGKSKQQLTGKQAEEFVNKATADVLAAALWPA